jgi:hypothetical protein
MILLVAILAGMLVGLLLTSVQKRPWTIPLLRKPWLVILALIPQFFNSFLLPTRAWVSDGLAAVGLIASMVLLLIFCWYNRHLSGVWLLALGLVLNLLAIVTNGGFMPISPQVASHLVSHTTLDHFTSGDRFGYKDVLLLPEDTNFAWLSDHFVTPEGFPYQVAFSIGDGIIAAGAFWLMATQGKGLQILRKLSKG